MAHRTEFKTEHKEELSYLLSYLYPNNSNFNFLPSNSPASLHVRTLLAPFESLLTQYEEKMAECKKDSSEDCSKIETQLKENLSSISSEKEREIVKSYIRARTHKAETEFSLKKFGPESYNTSMAQVLQIDSSNFKHLIKLTSPPVDDILFPPTVAEKTFSVLWKEIFDWATLQLNVINYTLDIYRIKFSLNLLKYAGIPLCTETFLAQLSNHAVDSLQKFLDNFLGIFFRGAHFKYGENGDVVGFDPTSVRFPYPGDAGNFIQQVITLLYDYRNTPTAPETILDVLSTISFSLHLKSKGISPDRQVQIVDSLLSNDYVFPICQRIQEKLKTNVYR